MCQTWFRFLLPRAVYHRLSCRSAKRRVERHFPLLRKTTQGCPSDRAGPYFAALRPKLHLLVRWQFLLIAAVSSPGFTSQCAFNTSLDNGPVLVEHTPVIPTSQLSRLQFAVLGFGEFCLHENPGHAQPFFLVD